MKTLNVLLLLAFSCTMSFAQVKSDYDKETDFESFKTVSFKGWEKNSDQILNDFDKKRITESLKNEFSSRGMTLVQSDSDVDITLYVVVKEKTSTSAYTDYNYTSLGYRRGRWGWRNGAGFVSSNTIYNEDDYLEGTLVVDMYNHGTKELVWQGVLTTVVKTSPKKREKTIPKKIKKLMKKYPVKPIKK